MLRGKLFLFHAKPRRAQRKNITSIDRINKIFNRFSILFILFIDVKIKVLLLMSFFI